MKQELEELGIELAKLAKKYESDYITIAYVNGSIQGNNDPDEQDYMNICLDKWEVEKKCLTEKTKNYKD